jgi:DNA phosphorothioation-dependent restriction protein DptG
MIKNNEDRLCVKQLQKDITSLMLVVSKKYSSECFIDSLVDYPSVFYLIDNDSSDSSNQASSLTDDTADSDWKQNVGKSNTTRSVESGSETLFSTYKKHQITYQFTLVKIVMIVKNNIERIAQKKQRI